MISQTRPFYSSLQIAIWQREHPLAMLDAPGSPWDFEHQGIDGNAGLPNELGSRPVWPSWAYGRVWLDDLRFFLRGIANH